MVKYGISGRPRMLQMYNTKEHCGMFCKAVARYNMRVVMDRVHMRTLESTVFNPSMSICYSNHSFSLWCPNFTNPYPCTFLLSVRIFFCGGTKFLVNFCSHLNIVRCAYSYQKPVSLSQYQTFVL
jgi:hypothetical protein